MEQNKTRPSLIAGANLKRLIKEAGITQDEAASRLLLGEGRCVRRFIRNGITRVDEIQRIADLLGVSLFEMLTPRE